MLSHCLSDNEKAEFSIIGPSVGICVTDKGRNDAFKLTDACGAYLHFVE
jgi:hypothetical protein